MPKTKKPSIEDAALNFSQPKRKDGRQKAGFPPAGHVRLNANITRELHMRIKIEAAKQGRTISDMISEWIAKNTPKV